MKASEVKDSLAVAFNARRSAFLWGPPGVGKSQVVAQVAASRGVPLNDVRASTLDPVDVRGLPRVTDDNRTKWCPPDFLPDRPAGVLFLDELNAAPPLVMAACYELILNRRVADYRLPDDWAIVGAGNRETDRAVVNRMPSALANRFIHLSFDVDMAEWVQWALGAEIMTEVIAFIRFRPTLLHSFDPSKAEKSFPTPRTWEYVSDLIKVGLPKSVEFGMIAGTVGEGAAAEFIGFLKVYRDLPDLDQILLDPDHSPVPPKENAAALYAVATALGRKASPQNFESITRYAKRFPSAEFNILTVRDAVKLCPDVCKTRSFQDWASCPANSKLLI